MSDSTEGSWPPATWNSSLVQLMLDKKQPMQEPPEKKPPEVSDGQWKVWLKRYKKFLKDSQ